MPKNILIIDDDQNVLKLISRLVEDLGHTPICVENGTQAIRYLISDKADLAIVDILLPGICGVELMFRFKELRLPIIVVSGLDKEEVLNRVSKELGIVDFIKKPFTMQEFQKSIETVKDPIKRGFQ